MHRGSALPLLIVAGFLIVSSFYLISIFKQSDSKLSATPQPSASPDPYQGWNTYTNPQFNFSMRYPSDWDIKEYQTHSADFFVVDPSHIESTTGAATVRFISSSNKADITEFEKIQKLDNGSQYAERLDVKSLVTKINSFEINSLPAIDYIIERAFSALEGPKGEYSHIVSVNKDGTILKFISRSVAREEQTRFNEPTFSQIISSINFQ